MNARAARSGQRGQTLPMWTFAVLTALTLMFFSLNYANEIRWEVRAQNAADAAATAGLSVQATQWNKMMAVMYAADVEEWRIRHLIQGMIDAANQNGGCKSTGRCLPIYNALQAQYDKAIARYTTEIQILQSMAVNGRTSQAADAARVVHNIKASCGSATPHADCAFTYHVVNYGYRTTTQQAGKDAFYMQLGGFTSPQDSVPVVDWEPAQIEIATCATVTPLVSFSLFSGAAPASVQVIGRAAATNVTETADWLAPGVTINPATGAYFQPLENYDPTDDVFAGTSSPRPWYETNYPAINYKAYPAVNNYNGIISDDFEIMLCWWAAIPEQPYSGAQSASAICTDS